MVEDEPLGRLLLFTTDHDPGTVWPDIWIIFSIFDLYSNKNLPNSNEVLPNTKNTLKMTKAFLTSPKWQKFAKVGHTAPMEQAAAVADFGYFV